MNSDALDEMNSGLNADMIELSSRGLEEQMLTLLVLQNVLENHLVELQFRIRTSQISI